MSPSRTQDILGAKELADQVTASIRRHESRLMEINKKVSRVIVVVAMGSSLLS